MPSNVQHPDAIRVVSLHYNISKYSYNETTVEGVTILEDEMAVRNLAAKFADAAAPLPIMRN